MDKVKYWIVKHKFEFLILAVILLLGAFIRLYKINGYLTFLGDEGRDVIIVRRLLIEHHPPLIGPGTSIGNMYLGPIYYYMMAIPLLLANFSPVGPAVFIAILGVVTIFFLWFIINEWFPTTEKNWGALIASFLYAISPVIIIYSRSSWNPNIMPFFSLLTIYSIWRVYIYKNYKWLIITGISFACVLQSHYLGLLLLPVILIFWFLTFLNSKNRKTLFIYSFLGLFIFALLMSPLLFFDIRHNFINFKAMKAFFTDRQTTISIKPWTAIPSMWPILINISSDLVGAKIMLVGVVTTILVSFYFIYEYLFRRQKYDETKTSIVLIITLWLLFALLGLGLYKQHIYDHYFGFIFAIPFIVIGALLNRIFKVKNMLISLLAVVFVLAIVVVDIQNLPLNASPNRQLERAIVVAKKVEEISNGQRFNFALIADNNYDSAYRYFLNINDSKVVDIDPQNPKSTITGQLIVVCERENKKCDPTHNPKAEVAQFGWSKILNEWDNVFGVTIYKLGHVLH